MADEQQKQTQNQTPAPAAPTPSTPVKRVILPVAPGQAKPAQSGATSAAAGTPSAPANKGLLSGISGAFNKKAQVITEPVPEWINVLRIISLVLLVVGGIASLWITQSLSESNALFRNFGVQQNTGIAFSEGERSQRSLESQKESLEKKIKTLQFNLENNILSVNSEVISDIKDKQKVWIDTYNEDGTIARFGILDAPGRMETYFNEGNGAPNVVLQQLNNLEITSMSVSKNSVNISVRAQHSVGRIFFLASEFVRYINGFPFFNSGEIRTFTRGKNNEGEEEITFSLSLQVDQDLTLANMSSEIQKRYDEQIDSKFSEYLLWLQGRNQTTGPRVRPTNKDEIQIDLSDAKDVEENTTDTTVVPISNLLQTSLFGSPSSSQNTNE